MTRREIVKLGLAAAPALAAGASGGAAAGERRARVALVRTEDRSDGIRRVLTLLGAEGFAGRHVVVKPNFNSADPYPGSTHPDALEALVDWLGRRGASRVTVADRSGMGDTRRVMDAKGVFAQSRRLGVAPIVLDEVPARDWIPHRLPGSHWSRGVLFPRVLEEAEVIVSTCCLKTHRFGGHFTLSLKNSVGAVAKTGPDGYDYMRELHGSAAQRQMIAETNLLYRPALILLDGLEAFVSGGPETGETRRAGVLIAGTDRVAVDAVGVAALRLLGTTRAVATGPVFAQEQIARAAELGIGVARPELIDLVTDSREGETSIARLRPILLAA
jgi:uncharacterized protein (DUF362 family)